MSPITALQKLKLGNSAFAQGKQSNTAINCTKLRKKLATEGQNPFAVIITCADSRVPAEAIFQTDLGDLFVIRVAGCCVDLSVIASVEYAISQFDCQVCIVMGHTECGAINAALNNSNDASNTSDNILRMLAPLRSVIENERNKFQNLSPKNTLNKISKITTLHQIKTLKEQSHLIRSRQNDGILQLIPARYDIHSGNVVFDKEA